MKRRSLLAWLAIGLVVLLSLFGAIYLNSDRDSGVVPEGTFGIKGVEYLTPISSSTKDYFLEQYQGTLYAFYSDAFYIDYYSSALDSSFQGQSFSDVTYKETPLGNKLNLTGGLTESLDLSAFTEKRAFRIFAKELDTGYAIYLLDDEIWLAYSNPCSKSKFAEYVFSLEEDQLQNQSAAEILSILIAADFPIKEPVVVNEQSDPNHLMGTPGGYICKAEWIDARGVASIRSSVIIEVFRSSKDCQNRKDSLEKLYAYISSDGYYYFSEGKVLIAVQKGITKTQASIYGEALEAIKNGEMPKNN